MMSGVMFFLMIGLVFLAALVLWVQRSAAPAVEAKTASEVQEVLTAVHLELPSWAVGERIFALQDWEFVQREAPRHSQEVFLRQRKALALSWLNGTRAGLQRLIQFHRKAARGDANLSPTVELKIAASYLAFVMVFDLLSVMIWLRGPFAARTAVGYAAGIAEQLSYLSGNILVGLDPARLSAIKVR